MITIDITSDLVGVERTGAGETYTTLVPLVSTEYTLCKYTKSAGGFNVGADQETIDAILADGRFELVNG
jgi:hypothetical protein